VVSVSEELRVDGLGIAPGVLETIVTLAARNVDGVAGVCGSQGLAQLAQKAVAKQGSRCVDVATEDDAIAVSLHIDVAYGLPLREVGEAVKAAVADAIKSQLGAEVSRVDVFIDGLVFQA
jgi:uncharacterized alkaline shock family protein YloU